MIQKAFKGNINLQIFIYFKWNIHWKEKYIINNTKYNIWKILYFLWTIAFSFYDQYTK